MEISVTSELIAAIAGAIISLGFSYIPGLNRIFATLEAEVKRLIMAGLMVLVGAAVYGLGCWGVIASGVSCDTKGIWQLVALVLTAIIANQSVFKISPQTEAVRFSRPLEVAFIPDEEPAP